jgi:hypothetical protein
LCHVDINVLELAVEVGIGDVDGLKLQVLKSSNRESLKGTSASLPRAIYLASHQ